MLQATRVFERLEVAGVNFDFALKSDVLDIIERWRSHGHRSYICLTNPHSVMLCHRDPQMRTATAEAGLTLPDGIGIILAGKILGYGRRHRVTGPALMLELCDHGRTLGYRHYFYGGADGIPNRLADRLCEQFPGLIVAGVYSPPFRELTESEDADVVERINVTRPDIVWVGLGAPKQEKWMTAHLGRIRATAMIGVGAAFDFHSGNVKWAPGWVRKWGLEWVYRLVLNPRRMWRRNLDSPLFLMHVLAQAVRERVNRLLPRPATFTQPSARPEGRLPANAHLFADLELCSPLEENARLHDEHMNIGRVPEPDVRQDVQSPVVRAN